MAAVSSVASWVQLVLNGTVVLGGAAVWKLYVEKLKATIGSKDAEVAVANQQVDLWRDKAIDLEKRSPEVVERVLAERIKIREEEIAKLALDKEHGSKELKRVEQEVVLMRRTLDQTKGFREMLALEEAAPDPEDPDYPEYLEWLESEDHSEERVVEIEVEHLGNVGVDSGQLLITDPCYVDSQWQDEPYRDHRVYRDTQTGATVQWGEDFTRFDQPLEGYGETPTALLQSGRLVQLPPPPAPGAYGYSYNGACQATLSAVGYGELVYRKGHAGAGVAFRTAWGDGVYPIYGEKHDGRIVRVYVNVG